MHIEEHNGARVLHLPVEGPVISTPDDAADLVADTWAHAAKLVAVPVERLDPEFFTLGSDVSGGIRKKLAEYRLRLAIIGDITEHLEASDALRDYVWESNRGTQLWFVPDAAALGAKLG